MHPRAEPYRVVLEDWAAALKSGDAASLACLHAFFSDAYLRTLETFPETEFSETGLFGEMAS